MSVLQTLVAEEEERRVVHSKQRDTHTLLHVTPLQGVPDLLLAILVKWVQVGPETHTHSLSVTPPHGPEAPKVLSGALRCSYLTVPLNSTGS